MELFDWFKGFEKGIAKLTEAQRETFFRECGKNCVQCGTLQIYKDLYEQAAGDLDLFFTKANELPGVRCETIEKGAVYNLYFLECTCGLHKQGYVSTPMLCECFRHSLRPAFIMERQDFSGNYLRIYLTGRPTLQNAN